MVFQHFALFPHRTVRENAAYGLKVRGASPAEQRERADWALEKVGLGGPGATRGPGSCRAACSSGSAWPAAWRPTPTCC